MKFALFLVACGLPFLAMPVMAQEMHPRGETANNARARALVGTAPKPGLMASSIPEGFENLLKPMPVVVDLYFGGTMIGTTSGMQAPGHFNFDEPDKVVDLIPGVMDKAKVIAALSGDLDGHTGLVCGPAPRPDCGRLDPPVAGIIYNPMNFRVDIFVTPSLLEIVPLVDDPYLPIPSAGLSFISNFAGSVNGIEGERANYTIQNRSILAYRNMRVVSDVSQASRYGFQTQILAAEMDTSGLRYRGGLFWSEPLAFTGQTRVYGASISSQFDTLAGGDTAYTRPLVVFLSRRAQVNVYRDGLLIGSALLDSGNQTLDTTNFPAGAYNLTVEIAEQGGETRSEIHFFTKNRTLPPVGRTAFSLTGGILARDSIGALPEMTGDAFAQGTMAFRVRDNLAVDGGALLVGSDFVAEAGSTYLGDGFTAHVAGLAGTDGNFGAIAEFSWFDLRNLSVNAYARRTWGPGLGGIAPENQLGITPVNSVNLLVGDSRQFGGNLGWRFGRANLRFSGFYYELANAKAFYSYGPSFDYAWRAGSSTQLTLFADGRRSSEGWDARVGIRLSFNRGHYAVFGDAGGAYRKIGSAKDSGPVGSILASYSTDEVLDSTLTVDAGYARDLDNERVRGEVTLDGQYGRFTGQAEHAFDAPNGGTRYSANFATSIAVGGGKATIGGQEIGQSGILVSLNGGNADLEVDVLVDNSPRARIRPGQAVPIFLPAYRTYSVRLAPVNGATGRFDTASREVTLFAGNLASVAWSAEIVQAVFGRLVDVSGKPVANALITASHDFMQTDDNGYFQGEISIEDEFVVRDNGKQLCRLELPALDSDKALLKLGDVRCHQ